MGIIQLKKNNVLCFSCIESLSPIRKSANLSVVSSGVIFKTGLGIPFFVHLNNFMKLTIKLFYNLCARACLFFLLKAL